MGTATRPLTAMPVPGTNENKTEKTITDWTSRHPRGSATGRCCARRSRPFPVRRSLVLGLVPDLTRCRNDDGGETVADSSGGLAVANAPRRGFEMLPQLRRPTSEESIRLPSTQFSEKHSLPEIPLRGTSRGLVRMDWALRRGKLTTARETPAESLARLRNVAKAMVYPVGKSSSANRGIIASASRGRWFTATMSK